MGCGSSKPNVASPPPAAEPESSEQPVIHTTPSGTESQQKPASAPDPVVEPVPPLSEPVTVKKSCYSGFVPVDVFHHVKVRLAPNDEAVRVSPATDRYMLIVRLHCVNDLFQALLGAPHQIRSQMDSLFGNIIEKIDASVGAVESVFRDTVVASFSDSSTALYCGWGITSGFQEIELLPGVKVSATAAIVRLTSSTLYCPVSEGTSARIVTTPSLLEVDTLLSFAAPGQLVLSRALFDTEKNLAMHATVQAIQASEEHLLVAAVDPAFRPAERADLPDLHDQTANIVVDEIAECFVPTSFSSNIASGEWPGVSNAYSVSVLLLRIAVDDTGFQSVYAAIHAKVASCDGLVDWVAYDGRSLTISCVFGVSSAAGKATVASLKVASDLISRFEQSRMMVVRDRAFCGFVGCESQRRFVVSCHAINESLRVLPDLGAGAVFCDRQTALIANSAFLFVPAVNFMQRAHDHSAFLILDTSSDGAAVQRNYVSGDIAVPIVRDIYPEAVDSIRARVLDKRPGIVGIVGPDGQFKSTIVEAAIDGTPTKLIRGCGGDDESEVPYSFLHCVIREFLSPEFLLLLPHQQRDFVVQLLPVEDRVHLSLLCFFLGIDTSALPRNDIARGAGGYLKESHTTKIIASLLQRILDEDQSEMFTVFLLYKAHWMDRWSMQVLAHLRSTGRTLFVLVGRHVHISTLCPEIIEIQSISTTSQVQVVISSRFPDKDSLPEDFLSSILQQCEAQPKRLFELLSVFEQRNVWAEPMAPAIPYLHSLDSTELGTAKRTFGRLDEEERFVVAAATVVGPVFDISDLARIVQLVPRKERLDEPTLFDLVDRLSRPPTQIFRIHVHGFSFNTTDLYRCARSALLPSQCVMFNSVLVEFCGRHKTSLSPVRRARRLARYCVQACALMDGSCIIRGDENWKLVAEAAAHLMEEASILMSLGDFARALVPLKSGTALAAKFPNVLDGSSPLFDPIAFHALLGRCLLMLDHSEDAGRAMAAFAAAYRMMHQSHALELDIIFGLWSVSFRWNISLPADLKLSTDSLVRKMLSFTDRVPAAVQLHLYLAAAMDAWKKLRHDEVMTFVVAGLDVFTLHENVVSSLHSSIVFGRFGVVDPLGYLSLLGSRIRWHGGKFAESNRLFGLFLRMLATLTDHHKDKELSIIPKMMLCNNISFALHNALQRRSVPYVHALATKGLALLGGSAHHMSLLESHFRIFLQWAHFQHDPLALDELRTACVECIAPDNLAKLAVAECFLRTGKPDDPLCGELIHSAFLSCDRSQRDLLPEAYRVMGLQQIALSRMIAEKHFYRAMFLAESAGSAMLQLRACVDLSHMRLSGGDPRALHRTVDILTGILETITEDFSETTSARTLLAEMRQAAQSACAVPPASLRDSLQALLQNVSPEEFSRAFEQMQSDKIDHQVARIGQPAGTFSVVAASSKIAVMADMLRRGPVVLCFALNPECALSTTTLLALQEESAAIEALDATIVVVVLSGADAYASKHNPTFYIIEDSRRDLSESYGLLYDPPSEVENMLAAIGARAAAAGATGVEHLALVPATYIVDQTGTIVDGKCFADPLQIMDPRDIVDSLRRLHHDKQKRRMSLLVAAQIHAEQLDLLAP